MAIVPVIYKYIENVDIEIEIDNIEVSMLIDQK